MSLLVLGKVITLNPEQPTCSVLVSQHSRIIYAGEDESKARQIAGADAKVLDLRSTQAVITPGFNDAHTHLVWEALQLAQVTLRADKCPDIPTLLKLLADKAKTTPPGVWVRGQGYDHNKLKEKRHPTLKELDAAVPSHAVWISHTSGHFGVANSKAFAAANITKHTVAPVGGKFVLDSDGELNGLVEENALDAVKLPVPDIDEIVRALGELGRQMLAEGLTSVQDAGVGFQHPLEALALQTAVERGVFPQRIGFAITQPNVFDEKTGKIKLPVGLKPPLGNDSIKWNGVKMWADGSLIGRTAAMSHDYCGEPGNKGYMRIPRPELQKLVAEAHRAGWQCWTHAIGDAAVEEVVDAYEAAIKNFPRKEPARHRIEHCGLLNKDLIKRIADLGLVVVSQPRFISELGDGFRSALGAERTQLCYPLATLLKAGVHLAGSSDRPVVRGAPLLGMHDCVNQTTRSGEKYSPQEALTPQ